MAEDDDHLTSFTQSNGIAPVGCEPNYLPGDIVDSSYQLRKVLGRGGMGVVFSAYHTGLKRDYALKILAAGNVEAENWSRFQLEARALARLAHPSIVGIHNMGVDRALYPYYVMDLLPGESLAETIHRQGRLSEPLVISLFIAIADALKSAHAKGIIHRDLKPSNLMVLRDPDGEITGLKLVDFGIARLSRSGLDKQSQTATGAVFGTPFYMSPEQCQGERVDERSDIYSLGCTIFEAMSGRPPFVGENAFATFIMHQTAPLPELSGVAGAVRFSDSLDLFMAKMLAKKPADRFQSMEQVEHALMRIQSGRTLAPQAMSVAKSSSYDFNRIDQAIGEPHSEEPTGGGHKLLLALAASALTVSILVGIAVCFVPGLVSRDSARESQLKGKLSPAAKGEELTGAGDGKNLSPLSTIKESLLGEDESASGLLAHSIVKPDLLRRLGASEPEIALVQTYNWDKGLSDVEKCDAMLNHYLHSSEIICRTDGRDGRILKFPSSFNFCHISVNGGKPVMAAKEMRLKDSDSITVYLSKAVDESPQLLEKVSPDCLTGLECVFRSPGKIRPIIANWHRLRQLCFFNSLGKCLPKNEIWDESDLTDRDLLWIDRLEHIESLGLCGKDLNQKAIAKMNCLHRLKTLKLKRIPDCSQLLPKIATLGNINELWIVACDFDDNDLKKLISMKNLNTLRIRRSRLTPASLKSFKQMSGLKHLILDRPFSPSEKAKFKNELADCQFEPVLDTTYWDVYFLP